MITSELTTPLRSDPHLPTLKPSSCLVTLLVLSLLASTRSASLSTIEDRDSASGDSLKEKSAKTKPSCEALKNKVDLLKKEVMMEFESWAFNELNHQRHLRDFLKYEDSFRETWCIGDADSYQSFILLEERCSKEIEDYKSRRDGVWMNLIPRHERMLDRMKSLEKIYQKKLKVFHKKCPKGF